MKKNRKTIHKNVNQFPVIIQEDESGGYWVNCPVLDGCYSQGETIDQALVNIQEAISLCLEEIPKTKKIQASRKQSSLHLVQI